MLSSERYIVSRNDWIYGPKHDDSTSFITKQQPVNLTTTDAAGTFFAMFSLI